MKKVVVVDYDPAWADTFAQLRKVYQTHLGDWIEAIEHVGSTAIPGLAAKPVLDIDLVISERSELPKVIEKLEELGYQHRGDLGIKDREAFRQFSEYVPTESSGTIWQKHHLYVCVQGSVALLNHLNLRDYLRTHPEKVQEYGRLKTQLAIRFPTDAEAYTQGKTAFILSILKETGFPNDALQIIDAQNRPAVKYFV